MNVDVNVDDDVVDWWCLLVVQNQDEWEDCETGHSAAVQLNCSQQAHRA